MLKYSFSMYELYQSMEKSEISLNKEDLSEKFSLPENEFLENSLDLDSDIIPQESYSFIPTKFKTYFDKNDDKNKLLKLSLTKTQGRSFKNKTF